MTRKIIFFFLGIFMWLGASAQQSQVTVSIAPTIGGCTLQTDCANDFVCFDILMNVDIPKSLDSYNIWVTYDNTALSRVSNGDDGSCVIGDGGDTDLEALLGAYRVGGIPTAPVPMPVGVDTAVHTICFEILDLAIYDGSDIIVGGDKFSGGLRTTVTFTDATLDDMVPEDTLVVSPATAPCLTAPPLIAEGPQVTDEEMPITFCPDISDVNVGDTLIVTGCSAPFNGSAVTTNDTCITYTPTPNFNGVDSMCVQVCDQTGLCDSVIVPITVNPINDAPVAMDDTTSTPEETAVVVDVVANDNDNLDPLGNIDPTTVMEVDTPFNGSTSVNGTTGEITYTPDAAFTGLDSFTYVVCDDGNPLPVLCDTATVVIDVIPRNDPPVALDDSAITFEDVSIDIVVLANDDDPNDPFGNIDPAKVTEVTPPENGSISINPTTGLVTYTPSLNYYGLDTFTYAVCDDGDPLPSECDTAMVTITVIPVNDKPVAVNDTVTTPEDTPIPVDVTANDNDDLDPLAEMDPATVQILTDPVNGMASVAALTGIVTYTPNMDFVGTDSMEYVACDDGNPSPDLCDTAWVYITITPVNDPPMITEIPQSTPEDTSVTFCPTVSDIDAADILTVTTCSTPFNGTAVPAPGNCITYTPNPNFNGFDSVCVMVCDNGSPILCDSVIVPIRVTPVNDQPLAVNDRDTTDEDVPLIIDVLSNDNDDLDPLGNIDPMTVTEVDTPSNGSISINPINGEITYTPDLDFNGMDTFSYAVCDDGNPLPAMCDTAQVFLFLNPIQDCDSLVLSVFLEGAFNGTNMTTILNDYRLLPGQDPMLSANPGAQFLGVAAPNGQPYNVAPWNHMGFEGDIYGDTGGASTAYPATVTDWVLVSVRETDIFGASEVWKCATLLHSDGSIQVPVDCPCLALQDSIDYRVVVEHRNHLVVMSQVVQKAAGSLTFDFTTSDTYLFGTGSPNEATQKQIGNTYVMYGGNGNQTSGRTDINSADNAVWITNFGDIFRYQYGDNTLNADVNSVDRSLWLQNNGFFNLIQF